MKRFLDGFGMRRLANDQRGVAWTFCVGVAAIFITIVVWRLCTGVMDEVLGVADNLGASGENSLGIGTSTRTVLWNLLPILICIGIILWMIMRSQKEIYGTGHGI